MISSDNQELQEQVKKLYKLMAQENVGTIKCVFEDGTGIGVISLNSKVDIDEEFFEFTKKFLRSCEND